MTWRERWYEVIFEADTRAGKVFDVLLLIAIFVSVLVVILDSVYDHSPRLEKAEWFFTILFTVEYAARIACAPRRLRYILSFYGIIDLLSILPTYFMVLIPGMESAAVLRALRLLRVFRVLKLAQMLSEATALRRALWTSRSKIAVFLAFVLVAVVILGSAMHVIEQKTPGFDSIPHSMYWAIVTMTTVGYGDVSPEEPLGKALASVIMVLGYSLIIIPTGIVTAELTQTSRKTVTTQVCPECMAEGHDVDASHCKYCGGHL
jgi:voltage-gated potassium channel